MVLFSDRIAVRIYGDNDLFVRYCDGKKVLDHLASPEPSLRVRYLNLT